MNNNLVQQNKQKNRESQDTALVPSELHILETEADRYGYEITKMSDFMGLYVQQLTHSLAESSFVEEALRMPIANIGIINDAIRHATVISKDKISLVPDFENLPLGIKEKLKKGIYSIGDSKQVDGNLRAVILDENGVRVKDITLKKVISNPATNDITQSIAQQIQMKQIQDTLREIQEKQSYQLDCDRDNNILKPFFSARDNILHAQNAESIETRNNYLKKASDEMRDALNSVYLDMNTASKYLAKKTKWLLFHRQSTIDMLLSNLSDDLLLATKFCGMQMQIYDALGQKGDTKLVFEHYQAVMLDFTTKKINGRGMSAIELMHDHYTYTEDNKDCWYIFSKEMEAALRNAQQTIENKKIYIVSTEGKEYEQE